MYPSYRLYPPYQHSLSHSSPNNQLVSAAKAFVSHLQRTCTHTQTHTCRYSFHIALTSAHAIVTGRKWAAVASRIQHARTNRVATQTIQFSLQQPAEYQLCIPDFHCYCSRRLQFADAFSLQPRVNRTFICTAFGRSGVPQYITVGHNPFQKLCHQTN